MVAGYRIMHMFILNLIVVLVQKINLKSSEIVCGGGGGGGAPAGGKSFAAGAPPQTPLGELMTLPQTP